VIGEGCKWLHVAPGPGARPAINPPKFFATAKDALVAL